MEFLVFLTITITLASGVILGLTLISEKDKLLRPAYEYLKANYPTAGKPILTCFTCMASVWTFVVQFLLWSLFSEYFHFIAVYDFFFFLFTIVYWDFAVIKFVFQFIGRMFFVYCSSALIVTFVVNYCLHKLNYYR